MLWMFVRHHQVLLLETVCDDEAGEYAVIVRRPDHPEQAERFADRVGVSERLVALQHTLQNERWVRLGTPAPVRRGSAVPPSP